MIQQIRPKKSLGQHFLRDARISRNIVEAIAPQRGDVVLEIGPGEGALTGFLAATECTLVLVDLDVRVIAIMRERFGDRAAILHQDILSLDPLAVALEHHVPRIRVVGNIPYYITTPIFFHFLDRRAAVQDLTLMMQREVGRRVAATPGSKEYGIVSVIAQMHADVDILFDVLPGSFFPRPTVMSTVVRVRMLPAPRFPVTDERYFRKVVRTAFGKRRKTLRNSLRDLGDVGLEKIDRATLSRRAEELTVEEFSHLANTLADRVAVLPQSLPNHDHEDAP